MKKNLPDRYFYPAVFIYEDGQEIAVDFPDLGVATSGTSGEPIPAPSALSAIQPKENERVVLVDAYMPSVRLASVNRSVNRTVTLPAWLNAAALERNVNFSQVLQDALKHQLHLA